MSLRQYVLEVLREHCLWPTVDEWLDGLSCLTPVELDAPTAEVVRRSHGAGEGC